MSRGSLLLQLRKEKDTRFVMEERHVEWVNPEKNADGTRTVVRKPTPKKRQKSRFGFRLAGKLYKSVDSLTKEVVDEEHGRYKDSYGRNVIEVTELFPCFDSYDYATENRYYHWVFLVENNRLYCVYHADENKRITITSDVGIIEADVWRKLEWLELVQDVEVDILSI